jgi:surfeit locus 1 family protein
VAGLLDRFPTVGLKLAGADVGTAGWPSVVQVLDAEKMGARLGKPVYPLQLLWEEAAAGNYPRDWRLPDLQPEKNRGYAVQWFALAALTAGYGLFWAVRKPAEGGKG